MNVPGAAIDIGHLGRMTGHQQHLAREVLGMFSVQAERIMDDLDRGSGNAAALVHTLKGAAQGIGAFGVVEAALAYEAVPDRGAGPRPLQRLRGAVAAARAMIHHLLQGSDPIF